MLFFQQKYLKETLSQVFLCKQHQRKYMTHWSHYRKKYLAKKIYF